MKSPAKRGRSITAAAFVALTLDFFSFFLICRGEEEEKEAIMLNLDEEEKENFLLSSSDQTMWLWPSLAGHWDPAAIHNLRV